jgi:hypothetical protein
MLKPVVTVVLALATLLTTVRPAHAQSSVATKPGFELLVPSGTVVPTGAQENDVKSAKLTAVQLSYGLRPDLVLTSTVGWARTTPLGLGPEAKLDLFTYDAGVEYRLARRSPDRDINFKPFTLSASFRSSLASCVAGLMTGQAPPEDARFFENPLPVMLHILAVIPYSLLGALQFAPALRRRAWHRAVGMALVPLGLLAALTGLWMAHFYPLSTGDGEGATQ